MSPELFDCVMACVNCAKDRLERAATLLQAGHQFGWASTCLEQAEGISALQRDLIRDHFDKAGPYAVPAGKGAA